MSEASPQFSMLSSASMRRPADELLPVPVSSRLSKQNRTELPPVFWKPMSVTLQVMTIYRSLRIRQTAWRAGQTSLSMTCAEDLRREAAELNESGL